MNILLTDLRLRMAFAAARDLCERGHTVCGLHFGAESPPPPAALCRALSGWTAVPDVRGEARAALVRAEAAQRKAVVFPLGAETLASLAGGPELVPDGALLAYANDKAAVLTLARSLGIETPEEHDLPQSAPLPAVVKYRNGEGLGLRAGARYAIAHTRAQLESAYARMADIAAQGGQGAPLIQPYLTGEGLGVSLLFDRESRPVAALCHRRLREYPVTGGPSAACEAIWDDGLVERAVRLLCALQWRGVAMVEFRGSVEQPVLMEINPRIWGSFPLTRASGSRFSERYVRAAAGERLPELSGPDYQLGAKMGFCLSNLAAAASYARRLSPGESARALRDAFTLRDGVFERGDGAAGRAYVCAALARHKPTGRD